MMNLQELKKILKDTVYGIDGNIAQGKFNKLSPDVKKEIYNYTKNCSSTKLTERIYWIINNLTDYPVRCKHPQCENPVRFRGEKYVGIFCSHSCNSKYKLMVCENPFSGEDGIARRKNGMLKKYGVEHNMKTNTSLEKRKNTYISNYGVEHPLKYQPIIKKIRSNNEKNGIWISRSEIKSFDLYKRYVKHFTNQQNLTQLPNYKFRGHSKNTTLYSLDHKFSCQQGFINNIPPYIIGNIVNLEFIPNTENSRKRENCSITMEELIDLFYRNHVTSFSI